MSSSLWIETGAPAQYVQAAPAAVTAPIASFGTGVMNNTNQNFDTSINTYLGGGVVLALLLAFGLHMLGFRFVVAVGGH